MQQNIKQIQNIPLVIFGKPFGIVRMNHNAQLLSTTIRTSGEASDQGGVVENDACQRFENVSPMAVLITFMAMNTELLTLL